MNNSFISYLNPVASVVLLVNKSSSFFIYFLMPLVPAAAFFFNLFSSDETAPDQTQEAKFYSEVLFCAGGKSHHLSTEFLALNTRKKMFSARMGSC